METSLGGSAMELYPEDGCHPDVGNRVVHDRGSDVGNVLGKRLLVCRSILAELLRSSGAPESEPPTVRIEKMGVSVENTVVHIF
jgi:hypothetical protein